MFSPSPLQVSPNLLAKVTVPVLPGQIVPGKVRPGEIFSGALGHRLVDGLTIVLWSHFLSKSAFPRINGLGLDTLLPAVVIGQHQARLRVLG